MNPVMFSSENEAWETPQEFFNELDKEFQFNLDPCATPENKKCPTFFTKEDNGLEQDWGGSEFSVILRMDGTQQGYGLRKPTRKAVSRTLL